MWYKCFFLAHKRHFPQTEKAFAVLCRLLFQLAGIYILRQESKIFCTVSTSYQQISTNTSCLENVQSICSIYGFQKQELHTAKSFKYSEQLRRFCHYCPSFKTAQNGVATSEQQSQSSPECKGSQKVSGAVHVQNRVSHQIRPGCSGIYAAQS